MGKITRKDDRLMEWKKESTELLNDFLMPIPAFVRIMIKRGIKKKIEEVAAKEQASTVEEDHVLHGFILATPKGSTDNAKKMLNLKRIDYSKYEDLFETK